MKSKEITETYVKKVQKECQEKWGNDSHLAIIIKLSEALESILIRLECDKSTEFEGISFMLKYI